VGAPHLDSRVALLLTAGLALTSSPAEAAAPRLRDSLAVLPIVVEGPHGAVSVSAIYEAVTRATQSRLGLRVISAEEMFVASQEGLVARVRDCGSDPACIAAKLRMFDARMGLVVVLNFQLAPPVYSLQLLDTDAGRKVADRVGEVGPGDDVLEVIAHHADALLDAEGFVKSGRILVEVDPPRAQLRLTPGLDPDPGTPNVFTVAPGRYAVDASLEGFAPAQTEVEVRSGETTTARLRLDEQVSLWRTPWPWVAIGAAVVGATVTAVMVSQRPDPCLCTTLGGVGCACQ
jgi:hypothetical protein